MFSGPINTIAIHPEGKAFASGGEDGYVRVHWVSLSRKPSSRIADPLPQFDESYFRSRPYGDLEPAD
jgi:translation initiation factor 3 subunit I